MGNLLWSVVGPSSVFKPGIEFWGSSASYARTTSLYWGTRTQSCGKWVIGQVAPRQHSPLSQEPNFWGRQQGGQGRRLTGGRGRRRRRQSPCQRGPVGSGPGYQICVTHFARCASQTHGHCRPVQESHETHVQFSHGRGLFEARNVRQNLIPRATAYGPMCPIWCVRAKRACVRACVQSRGFVRVCLF